MFDIIVTFLTLVSHLKKFWLKKFQNQLKSSIGTLNFTPNEQWQTSLGCYKRRSIHANFLMMKFWQSVNMIASTEALEFQRFKILKNRPIYSVFFLSVNTLNIC